MLHIDPERIPNKIKELSEIAGIFEMYVDDGESEAFLLKVKVKRSLTAAELPYTGIANYRVKCKGCSSFYLSIHPQETVEEALLESVRGFLSFYSPEAELQEVEDW